MGQRAQRMCSKCYQTALPGSPLCAKHKAAPDTRQRSPLKRLYDRKLWRVYTKQAVMMRDAQCTEVVNGTRCPLLATDIHHVVDAIEWVAQHDGDERSFYDLDNLAGLCHAHHARHTSLRRHGVER
jgi:hypothetical protein